MVATSKSLWDRWLSRKERSVEGDYFNPLDSKIGDRVTIDLLDHRNSDYTVKKIIEVDQRIGSASIKFADYYLQGGPAAVLRVFANESDGFDLVLLGVYYDQDGFGGIPWDGDGESIYLSCTGRDRTDGDCTVFEVTNGEEKTVFGRLGGKRVPIRAITSAVSDENGDGIAAAAEVEVGEIEFFDYSRTAKDEGGTDFTEYLFISFEKATMYAQMLSGMQIDPATVSIS